MALKHGLILIVLALAMAVAESSFSFDQFASPSLHMGADDGLKVGDLVNFEEEMMMTSETDRRILAQAKKYVSYNALKKNSVPCKKKGTSYYNCNSRQKANPYRRGCSRITNCQRYTDI